MSSTAAKEVPVKSESKKVANSDYQYGRVTMKHERLQVKHGTTRTIGVAVDSGSLEELHLVELNMSLELMSLYLR
jgi:hypothetical protein